MNFPDPCSAVAEAAELGCVIDHLRDVVFRVDALGCWRFLNRAWTELTGHGLADSLGSAFLRYVHPLDRDGVEALFQRFMAQAHKPCSQRLRLLRRDGSIVWVEASLRQVRDAQGQPLGITGTLADAWGLPLATGINAASCLVITLIFAAWLPRLRAEARPVLERAGLLPARGQ